MLIDGRIRSCGLKIFVPVPIFEINATEANKTVYSAIEFAEFMEGIGTTKSNMVYVVGGGIMQDIGALPALCTSAASMDLSADNASWDG